MKINILLPIIEQSPYLTKQNLSLALRKEGDALNYWVKKLIGNKAFIPLKKGFYVSSYYRDIISQTPKDRELYGEYLANILRYPSYVSLEYVLAKYNFIPEAPFAVTCVTVKSPRVYSSSFGDFIYRSVKENLFFGWEIKDFRGKEVRVASLPKALFDFLYLKKLPIGQWQNYLLTEGRFNWKILSRKEKTKFVRFAKNSGDKKMVEILNILRQGKIL